MPKVNKISNLPGWVADNSNPANLDSSGGKLTGLPTPTVDSDASTKKYVDDNSGGGGSQTQKIVRVPFAFDTPNILTGIAVYTPEVGETLMAWSRVTITTAFDGTPAPVFTVYSQGDSPADDYLVNGTIDGIGPDGPSNKWRCPALVFSNNDNGTVPFDSGLVSLTTTPILAKLDNGSGGDPGATHGVGEIVLVILAAP